MKTKYIVLLCVLVLFSKSALSQNSQISGIISNPHDSLLFDGANVNSFPGKSSCGCTIKILKQSGIVYGTECEKKMDETCGVYDTFYVKRKGIIPSYVTEILDGDTIRTGPYENCEIDLQLSDGKTVHMSRNTSMLVSKDHCKNPMGIILHYGMLYLDLTTGDKNKTISVKTERGEIINRGTRYSVEIAQDGDKFVDIVRVYEGSVTFQQIMQNETNIKDRDKNSKDMTDKGTQMLKLQEDYKSGKITVQEYSDKMKEIMNNIPEVQTMSPVTVEAGFESRINGSGNPTDPVAFDMNDDPKK